MTPNQKTTSPGTSSGKSQPSRRTLRRAGRLKRQKRIFEDQEFAKTYFDAKSKRSVEKKQKFRKKLQGKKKA